MSQQVQIDQAIHELRASGRRDAKTLDKLAMLEAAKAAQRRVVEKPALSDLRTNRATVAEWTAYAAEQFEASGDFGRRSVTAFVNAGRAFLAIRDLTKKKRGGWGKWQSDNGHRFGSRDTINRAMRLYQASVGHEAKLKQFTTVREAFDDLVRWQWKRPSSSRPSRPVKSQPVNVQPSQCDYGREYETEDDVYGYVDRCLMQTLYELKNDITMFERGEAPITAEQFRLIEAELKRITERWRRFGADHFAGDSK